MESLSEYHIDGPYVEDFIPSRGQIPSDPEPGNYVVIDVTHFSTTVLELFNQNAALVHVTEERGDEFEYKKKHPNAKIGGGSSDTYTPTEGYDFFNSPTYVTTVDVADRPTALTSSNGGAAITELRKNAAGNPDVDIYVGSTANAQAIADYLRTDDKKTIPLAAGSKRKPSPEDVIGGILIHRHLVNNPPTDAEIKLYQEIIKAGKAAKYVNKAAIRCNDLMEYSMQVNTHTAIPKLDGQDLIDVS